MVHLNDVTLTSPQFVSTPRAELVPGFVPEHAAREALVRGTAGAMARFGTLGISEIETGTAGAAGANLRGLGELVQVVT